QQPAGQRTAQHQRQRQAEIEQAERLGTAALREPVGEVEDDAGWLSDEQKRALEGELAEEDTRKQARGPHGFLSALRSGQVL
ncbi:hypothetical protein CJU33_33000, partial [Pseudomonas aeruginosa]